MSFTVTDKLFRNRCRDLVFASVIILVSLKHFTCFALNHLSDFSDSMVKKYPLTDPRNPKCPCYKLQKKADKEFNKLNKRNAATSNSHLSSNKNERKSLSPYVNSNIKSPFNITCFQKKPAIHKMEKRKKRSKFSLKKSPDSCPKWQFRR